MKSSLIKKRDPGHLSEKGVLPNIGPRRKHGREGKRNRKTAGSEQRRMVNVKARVDQEPSKSLQKFKTTKKKGEGNNTGRGIDEWSRGKGKSNPSLGRPTQETKKNGKSAKSQGRKNG